MKDTTVSYYPPQKIVNLGNCLIFYDFQIIHPSTVAKNR